MFKNVIFDFGQVLVSFEPRYMVSRYVSDPADIEQLTEIVFDRLYWDRLDAGTISDDELLSAVKHRIPERLWESAEKIYYNWIYNIPEIDGMREIVESLKENGIRIFVLSNISHYFAEHSNEIPILSLAEKCVYSAVCGFTKPSQEIFEYLCNSCDIKPSESIFIDDNKANILGAENFGIKGYLFDGDVQKLKKYLNIQKPRS